MEGSSINTAAGGVAAAKHSPHKTYKFSHVPGFFEDYAEIAKASPDGKVSTQRPGLGLIKRDYDGEIASDPNHKSDDDDNTPRQWTRFARYVEDLNRRNANTGVSYKLIYVTRHGKGFHNVKMDALVAAEEAGELPVVDGKLANWKNYWSHKDGDEEVTWADAHLVEKGIAQAQSLAHLWLAGAQHGNALPLPGTVYTSPLARCLETTKLMFAPVSMKQQQQARPLRPIVKENLRERVTTHTCDRRSAKSWIRAAYPEYVIEDGFSESDESWNPDDAETLDEHVERMHSLLEDIFASDDEDVVSLTTHSYTMTAILAVIGYPKFLVTEGTIVPFFVRAERVAA
ncbi:hypothetical protein M426DRAFT_14190 [Hypoxylon sp. CI-4A]|nr:hypothetical protein M426DRAFT_14190 [Hypoxylon sp. CI-4A]